MQPSGLQKFIKRTHEFGSVTYYTIVRLIKNLSFLISVDIDDQLALCHSDNEVCCTEVLRDAYGITL